MRSGLKFPITAKVVLWVSLVLGLPSANAVDWQVLNRANSDLPSDSISALGIGYLCPPPFNAPCDYYLFIGTQDSGLVLYLLDPFNYYTDDWILTYNSNTTSGFPSGAVTAIDASPTHFQLSETDTVQSGVLIGAINFGFNRKGVYDFDEDTFHDAQGGPNDAVSVVQADYGVPQIWAAASYGTVYSVQPLEKWEDGNWFTPQAPVLSSRATDLDVTNDSALWIATENGLILGKMSSDTGFTVTSIFVPENTNKASDPQVNAICRAANNILYMGTNTGGIYKCDSRDGSNFAFVAQTAEVTNIITTGFSSTEVIWVGTRDSGIYLLVGSNVIKRLTTLNSAIPSNVITVLESDGSDVWVGTEAHGLAKTSLCQTATVTLKTMPSGVSITVDTQVISNTTTIPWLLGSPHSLGVDSIVQISGQERLLFESWSNGDSSRGIIYHAFCEDTITAHFRRQFFVNLLNQGNGTIYPSSGWYDSGAVVEIGITPEDGKCFSGWTGQGSSSYTGPNSSVSLVLNGPIVQTAQFEDLPGAKQVYVMSNSGDFSFDVEGELRNGPDFICSQVGSAIWLGVDSVLEETDSSRLVFDHWSDSGGLFHHHVVSTAVDTLAAFYRRQFWLDIVTNGNGSVTPSSGWYDSGATITIAAFSDCDYRFTVWNGTGNGSFSGNDSNHMLSLTAPVSELATFALNTNQTAVEFTSISIGSNLTNFDQAGWVNLDDDSNLDFWGFRNGDVLLFDNSGWSLQLQETVNTNFGSGDSVALSDIDGNGLVDIWAVVGSDFQIYQNAGNDFTQLTIQNTNFDDYVGFDDIDQDGDLDLWGKVNNDLMFFLNHNWSFNDTRTLNSNLNSSVGIVNLNGTGNLDIWGLVSNDLTLFENINWSFNNLGTINTNIDDFAGMTDIDINGALDIWGFDHGDMVFYAFDSQWAYTNMGTLNSNFNNIAGVGDIDGDGDVDVWGLADGDIDVYLNKDWAFQELDPINGNYREVAGVADLDFDNDLDIWGLNNGELQTFRTDVQCKAHWVEVELVGVSRLLQGPALLSIVAGGRSFSKTYVGSPLRFLIGSAESYESITVQWPSGVFQVLPGGFADTSIMISEEQAPVIGTNVLINGDTLTAAPDSITSAIGGNLSLAFIEFGEDSYSFYWSHNGNRLYDGINISGSNSSTLEITNAQTFHSGNYVLHAVNSADTTESQPILLKVDTSTGVGDPNDPQLPKRFSLSQNYPNPFNPSTTIEFALPRSAKVKLTVYNILGQEVDQVINTFMPAGYHQVTWDGKNSAGKPVTTGMYFYRIVAGDFVVAKKMILLK